jgi:hypothetical protein
LCPVIVFVRKETGAAADITKGIEPDESESPKRGHR